MAWRSAGAARPRALEGAGEGDGRDRKMRRTGAEDEEDNLCNKFMAQMELRVRELEADCQSTYVGPRDSPLIAAMDEAGKDYAAKEKGKERSTSWRAPTCTSSAP